MIILYFLPRLSIRDATAIRAWVILPIVMIALGVGLGRHYVSQLIQTPPKSEKEKAFQSQAMGRSQKLCQNARFIPLRGFHARRIYFNGEQGLFKAKRPEGGAQNPATDPAMMMNMMQSQMQPQQRTDPDDTRIEITRPPPQHRVRGLHALSTSDDAPKAATPVRRRLARRSALRRGQ